MSGDQGNANGWHNDRDGWQACKIGPAEIQVKEAGRDWRWEAWHFARSIGGSAASSKGHAIRAALDVIKARVPMEAPDREFLEGQYALAV